MVETDRGCDGEPVSHGPAHFLGAARGLQITAEREAVADAHVAHFHLSNELVADMPLVLLSELRISAAG